jgi:hypothetical protein
MIVGGKRDAGEQSPAFLFFKILQLLTWLCPEFTRTHFQQTPPRSMKMSNRFKQAVIDDITGSDIDAALRENLLELFDDFRRA